MKIELTRFKARKSTKQIPGLSSADIEKFRFYEKSVQCPFEDIKLVNKAFKKMNGRRPLSLREDFCGSGWMACEWVKQSPKHKSVGIDLSPEPVIFGKAEHWAKLSVSQRSRVRYLLEDVRKKRNSKFDVIAALNFSYWIFKTRSELKEYFKSVYDSLNQGGVLMIDFFGGSESQEEKTRKTQWGNLSYYWQCSAFDPVNNHGAYAIHFKQKGKKTIRNAFMYHWRMWSGPELRDILIEVGFRETPQYWEGTNRRGGGDGNFIPSVWEENCQMWQAFILAKK